MRQRQDWTRHKAWLCMSTVATATLAGLTLSAPAATAVTQRQAPPIQTFRNFSSFAAATHVTQTLTFDEFASGTSLGNPVVLAEVNIHHSTAATFKAIGEPYVPVSPPNVLAPFASDGTLTFGGTTLTFQKRIQAAGLYLIIGAGSNVETTWTNTVTATDINNHSVSVKVTFQGAVGEQQFIGFKSPKLASITFDPAQMPGGSTVVAMDNVVVAAPVG
jgi:hypothetical protein